MRSGIPAWSDLTISDGLKYISGSYKIAMVYNGDSAPMLVLENKHSYSWDICISASEVSSGVAFYSYDTLHKLSATTEYMRLRSDITT